MSRPYGWTSTGNIVEDEAKELRAMAAHIIGGGTIRGLVTELQDRGVETVTGGAWAPITIRRALVNPRIAGHTPGVPGILDEKTHQAVVKILSDPKRKRFTPHKDQQGLLVAGRVRCAVCGTNMHRTKAENRQPDYACSGRTGGCAGVAIKAHLLEDEVAQRVVARLSDELWRQALADALVNSPDFYRQRIDDARQRMIVLAEQFGGGEVDRAALDAGLSAARSVIARAEGDLAMASAAKLLPSAEEVVAWWEEATMQTRRAAIDLVLERVDVLPKSGTKGVDERLRFHWK